MEVEGERGGGRSCTRYRLTDQGQINQTTPTLTVAHPDVDRCRPQRLPLPTPTVTVAEVVSKEVIEEEVQAAAASTVVPNEVQPPPVQPPAPLPTDLEQQRPRTDTAGRHTCPACGKSWPARFGTTCYHCPQPTAKQLRRQQQRIEDRAWEQEPPPPAADTPRPPGVALHSTYTLTEADQAAYLAAKAQESATKGTGQNDQPKGNACSPKPHVPAAAACVPPTAEEEREGMAAVREVMQRLKTAPTPPTPQRRGRWTTLQDLTSQRKDDG